MSLKSLVEDTLDVWREAERLLKQVSPLDPEHETVRKLVIDMRAMYAQLSSERDASETEAALARAKVAQARDLLRSLSRV